MNDPGLIAIILVFIAVGVLVGGYIVYISYEDSEAVSLGGVFVATNLTKEELTSIELFIYNTYPDNHLTPPLSELWLDKKYVPPTSTPIPTLTPTLPPLTTCEPVRCYHCCCEVAR